MPNYCFNSLSVIGDKERVNDFHTKWLKSEDPMKQRVEFATLRLLDWCYTYANITNKKFQKHGKKFIHQILQESYDMIHVIDILDDPKNDPAYFRFKYEDGTADDFFKEIIKHLYEIINLTPKQLMNRRILRDKYYLEMKHDTSQFRYSNVIDTPDILDYRDGLPCPKRFEDRFTFYYWNINNTGQKWSSPESLHFHWDGQAMQYTFDTAWGPSDLFVKHASKKYPDLIFELNFNETGMMFAGEFTYQNGKLVKQNVYEDSSYAGMQQFIGWDDEDILDDMWGFMEDIGDIREDCKGYINNKTIDAFFKIKRPKIKKKKNKKKSKSDVRQIRIKHVI